MVNLTKNPPIDPLLAVEKEVFTTVGDGFGAFGLLALAGAAALLLWKD